MAESYRINERLECRAYLPVCRSQRPIKFALPVIPSTYERTNSAAGIVDQHDRAFEVRHGRVPFPVLRRLVFRLGRMMEIGLMFYLAQLCLERILGAVLRRRIERGVNR